METRVRRGISLHHGDCTQLQHRQIAKEHFFISTYSCSRSAQRSSAMRWEEIQRFSVWTFWCHVPHMAITVAAEPL